MALEVKIPIKHILKKKIWLDESFWKIKVGRLIKASIHLLQSLKIAYADPDC